MFNNKPATNQHDGAPKVLSRAVSKTLNITLVKTCYKQFFSQNLQINTHDLI